MSLPYAFHVVDDSGFQAAENHGSVKEWIDRCRSRRLTDRTVTSDKNSKAREFDDRRSPGPTARHANEELSGACTPCHCRQCGVRRYGPLSGPKRRRRRWVARRHPNHQAAWQRERAGQQLPELLATRVARKDGLSTARRRHQGPPSEYALYHGTPTFRRFQHRESGRRARIRDHV
jgi:hypothetical protein